MGHHSVGLPFPCRPLLSARLPPPRPRPVPAAPNSQLISWPLLGGGGAAAPQFNLAQKPGAGRKAATWTRRSPRCPLPVPPLRGFGFLPVPAHASSPVRCRAPVLAGDRIQTSGRDLGAGGEGGTGSRWCAPAVVCASGRSATAPRAPPPSVAVVGRLGGGDHVRARAPDGAAVGRRPRAMSALAGADFTQGPDRGGTPVFPSPRSAAWAAGEVWPAHAPAPASDAGGTATERRGKSWAGLQRAHRHSVSTPGFLQGGNRWYTS